MLGKIINTLFYFVNIHRVFIRPPFIVKIHLEINNKKGRVLFLLALDTLTQEMTQSQLLLLLYQCLSEKKFKENMRVCQKQLHCILWNNIAVFKYVIY